MPKWGGLQMIAEISYPSENAFGVITTETSAGLKAQAKQLGVLLWILKISPKLLVTPLNC